jgi:hypothetical protein
VWVIFLQTLAANVVSLLMTNFPKPDVFYFLEYRTIEEVQEPNNSECVCFVIHLLEAFSFLNAYLCYSHSYNNPFPSL